MKRMWNTGNIFTTEKHLRLLVYDEILENRVTSVVVLVPPGAVSTTIRCFIPCKS